MSEEKKALNEQKLEYTSGGIKGHFEGITCPRCGKSYLEVLMYWGDGRRKFQCCDCGWEFVVI